MAISQSSTHHSGQRLFGCAVVGAVLVAASAIGLLDATSEETGGELVWFGAVIVSLVIMVGVTGVAVVNLFRRRNGVASTAALLVTAAPLIGAAAFALPLMG